MPKKKYVRVTDSHPFSGLVISTETLAKERKKGNLKGKDIRVTPLKK